jgi:cytidine deaminase
MKKDRKRRKKEKKARVTTKDKNNPIKAVLRSRQYAVFGGTTRLSNEMDFNSLVEAAVGVRERAYAPYSGFKVGAALLAQSGKVYLGCNIENGAYSPTICAERVALGSALAAGEKPGSFVAIAVVGDQVHPTTPCGVCRQVLYELAPGCTVVMEPPPEKGTGRLVMTVEELLPSGFRLGD